jgi:hypothetical protein
MLCLLHLIGHLIQGQLSIMIPLQVIVVNLVKKDLANFYQLVMVQLVVLVRRLHVEVTVDEVD